MPCAFSLVPCQRSEEHRLPLPLKPDVRTTIQIRQSSRRSGCLSSSSGTSARTASRWDRIAFEVEARKQLSKETAREHTDVDVRCLHDLVDAGTRPGRIVSNSARRRRWQDGRSAKAWRLQGRCGSSADVVPVRVCLPHFDQRIRLEVHRHPPRAWSAECARPWYRRVRGSRVERSSKADVEERRPFAMDLR